MVAGAIYTTSLRTKIAPLSHAPFAHIGHLAPVFRIFRNTLSQLFLPPVAWHV